MINLFLLSIALAILAAIYYTKINPYYDMQVKQYDVKNYLEYQLFLTSAEFPMWTSNKEQPFALCALVRGNKFVRVSNNQTECQELMLEYKSKARIFDFGKREQMIMPGFIDAHAHLILGGATLMGAPLRHVTSKQEFVQTLQQHINDSFVENGAEWVTGGNWNENSWGSILPTRAWIDEITGMHPTYLIRMDGHSCLCNTLALQKANITRDTPNPEGGEIVKDEHGEPTGVLKDLAMSLVNKLIPPPNPSKALLLAMKHAVSHGVTTVHNMGAGPFATHEDYMKEYEIFEQKRASNALKIRIMTVLDISQYQAMSDFLQSNYTPNNWLRIGCLKGFYDGSLGSQTALQFDPYPAESRDTPANYGIQTLKDEDLEQFLAGAEENKLQVAIHAIGERAIHNVLNAYEKVFKSSPERDRRWRVEHVQQCRPQDRTRFQPNHIIASIQPSHLQDDALYANTVLPHENVENLYAFASLERENVTLAMGTDWFVAPIDPILSLYSAVTRRTAQHHSWLPQERISLETALYAYTTGSAYAAFMEDKVGIIKEGYLADLVVLDTHLFENIDIQIDPAKIKDVRVNMTIVDGTIMYERV